MRRDEGKIWMSTIEIWDDIPESPICYLMDFDERDPLLVVVGRNLYLLIALNVMDATDMYQVVDERWGYSEAARVERLARMERSRRNVVNLPNLRGERPPFYFRYPVPPIDVDHNYLLRRFGRISYRGRVKIENIDLYEIHGLLKRCRYYTIEPK